MPAEWEQHAGTWMAFIPYSYELPGGTSLPLEPAQRAWASVANAISEFEAVSILVDPAQRGPANKMLSSAITKIEVPLDDGWLRDTGPTFVISENHKLAAIDWVFNGWGKQPTASWDSDQLLGKFVSQQTDAQLISSELVNEGGGIHVDGQGAVMLTETVQLGSERNPSWSRSQVEAELTEKLGVTKFIWMRRGLYRDYQRFGTRGHIDMVACFTPGGRVLVHDQRDASHPDFPRSAEWRETLNQAGLESRPLAAPEILRDDFDYVDFSYINHYVCNGAVIMGAFNDPADDVAEGILREEYPGREIVRLPAEEIFMRGGGIHCITQQQPAVNAK